MPRHRKQLAVVVRKCRRGCGQLVTGLSGPIHVTQADFEKYHGICYDCLTDDEKRDMAGPMLKRAAMRIVGRPQ